MCEALEKRKLLKRISVEADPELEISEIVQQLYMKNPGSAPALLFEKVKGSKFPLLINLLGTEQSIDLMLGRNAESAGKELTVRRMVCRNRCRTGNFYRGHGKSGTF